MAATEVQIPRVVPVVAAAAVATVAVVVAAATMDPVAAAVAVRVASLHRPRPGHQSTALARSPTAAP